MNYLVKFKKEIDSIYENDRDLFGTIFSKENTYMWYEDISHMIKNLRKVYSEIDN